jgi:hypothetical protein
MYVVIKVGRFRHEVVGVTSDFEISLRLAVQAKLKEHDDYHDFYVLDCKTDTLLEDGDLVAIVDKTVASNEPYRIRAKHDGAWVDAKLDPPEPPFVRAGEKE